MSAQFFSNLLLINKSTFIAEDIAFLTSFFCLQKDLPQDRIIKPWVWILILCIVISLLLDWIYHLSGVAYISTVICLPYIFINLYNLLRFKYCEIRLKSAFNGLCDCLKETHKLLKKLLNLAQELQVIEKNCSITDINSLKVAKSTFDITVKLFNVLREETKQALSLPATIEDVNQENNYISCLPSELFEELLEEENPTPYQLKSLIQLIRIQQSEFLRRILCAHVSGTLKEKCQIFQRIINSLQYCKKEISPLYAKLKSIHAFHHSSHYKQDQIPPASPLNHTALDHSYSIRQIRLHLRTALAILENIEDFNKKRDITEDLSRIEKELVSGIENVKLISRKFFKKDNSEFTEPIDSLQEKREKEETRTIIIGENYQPKIEDQVFELFIDDDDCLDFQYEDDIEDSTIIQDDFAAISSNLFQELKTALIPKAKEIQEREAKALGVPKESVPMQLNFENVDPKPKNNNSEIPLSLRQENRFADLLLNNSSLTTNLAARAAQISKDLNLNSLEECFGDTDEDSCDDGQID
ncbi:uncharacterized protein LOC107365516 [Tetranychus urticae]|uniref:Vezatin n=1 Tax=Tetranychus urticae TaxID=32264 RepID=T1KMM5_TETUR|nr:uncharacterized protein LOC107365516 [Tetranychus urticae]